MKQKNNNNDVEIWGTGSLSENLFSEDLGDAISFIHSMKKSDFYKITGPNLLSTLEVEMKCKLRMLQK